MDGITNSAGQLFLRTPDGSVYGPVDRVTLCAWATDARVIPGCALSSDRANWQPAETCPELRLNWMVQLPDGAAYGPLNLLAIWALADEASIHRGSTVIERSTGRKALLDASLLPLLIDESRLMLAAGGKLSADLAEGLNASRSGGDEALKAREGQILLLRTEIERVENELAGSLKLVGESQRYLVAHQEEAIKAAEAHALEVTAAKRESDALRKQLEETEKGRHVFEQDLVKSQAREAETKRALGEVVAQLATAEARRVDLATRLSAAEQGARRVGEDLKSALARAQEQQGRHASERDRLAAESMRMTGDLEAERAARLSGETTREAVIAVLKSEIEKWEGKFQSALVGVRKMEADLQVREAEFTAFRHQSERTEAELTAKAAALRKELDAAGRRVQESRELHACAQREVIQAREESVARVAALKEELAAVQRDLQGLLVVSDCVRQSAIERDSTNEMSIDWLDHNRDEEKTGVPRLSTAQQLETLSRNVRESAEENEALRRTLETQRASHAAACQESLERISQLQQKASASADMVRQAMEELERREAHMRLMRKKAEDRERELLTKIDEIERVEREAMVVHPEVILPHKQADSSGEEHMLSDTGGAKTPDGRDLLRSVEAQLRSELRKWETLGHKRGAAAGQARRWFARK